MPGLDLLMRLPRAVHVRSLKVAVVVGTVLNLINQPEALLGGGDLVLWKCALTYCVPFLVSTYGALSMMRAQDRAAQRG